MHLACKNTPSAAFTTLERILLVLLRKSGMRPNTHAWVVSLPTLSGGPPCVPLWSPKTHCSYSVTMAYYRASLDTNYLAGFQTERKNIFQCKRTYQPYCCCERLRKRAWKQYIYIDSIVPSLSLGSYRTCAIHRQPCLFPPKRTWRISLIVIGCAQRELAPNDRWWLILGSRPQMWVGVGENKYTPPQVRLDITWINSVWHCRGRLVGSSLCEDIDPVKVSLVRVSAIVEA